MTVHASEDQGWVEGSAQPDAVPGPRSRRPMLAGALGAAWALLVGVALVAVLVMLAWVVAPNAAGDSAAAWRAVGAGWLAAHLVPLSVSGQTISLLPIGGLLLGLMLTRRSGRWAARMLPEPRAAEVTWIVLGSAAAYGAGGAGVAWVSGGGSVSGDPAWAAAITAVVAAVGTLWGVARQADLVPVWRRRTRQAVWSTAMAGIAAVLGLLGAGATLVSIGLLTGFSEVAGTLADLDPGPVGAAGVTLLGLLSLPTLDVWAMSLVVGPGFDLGGLGGLSAFGGEVESLPALPVLAAIPATAPAWAPALLVVPVGLGVLAGRIRWGRDLPTPVGALVSGAGVAGVVAALVGGLVVLASGSLGVDRLAQVGPPLLPVMGSAAGLVALGFLLEAGYQSLRLSWDLHRAEGRASAEGSDRGSDEDPAVIGAQDGDSAGPGEAAQALAGADIEVAAAPAPGTPRGGALGRRAASAAGRVAGAGGAVASGITGAGASAVSVVAGAGSAVTSLVAGALARPEDSEDPAALDPEESAEETPEDPAALDPEESAQETPEEAAEETTPVRHGIEDEDEPGAGDSAADVLDLRSDVAAEESIDLRGPDDGAEEAVAGTGDADAPAVPQAGSHEGADESMPTDESRPVDDSPSGEAARGDVDEPDAGQHGPGIETPSPSGAEAPAPVTEEAPELVPVAADDPAPALSGGRTWAGDDDVTDEIPITRRIPASDAAQA